jgi:hypothetical protein
VLVHLGPLKGCENKLMKKLVLGQFFYFYEEPLVPVLKNKLEKFWFWFHM